MCFRILPGGAEQDEPEPEQAGVLVEFELVVGGALLVGQERLPDRLGELPGSVAERRGRVVQVAEGRGYADPRLDVPVGLRAGRP